MSANVTDMLTQITQGDQRAADLLLDSVYDELRARADAFLQQERRSHTLQPTALVHEAYLKLVDQDRANWQDRAHFIAVATQAMRRILIDHARGHGRARRGGAGTKVTLTTAFLDDSNCQLDMLELDEALNRLSQINSQAARAVELRFFGGLTMAEIATVLGVSESTVERKWRYARAWLFRTLRDLT